MHRHRFSALPVFRGSPNYTLINVPKVNELAECFLFVPD